MKQTFTIVVPALNEEKNIGPTVREIVRCFGSDPSACEILIFNDNSTDRTGARAEELAREYSNVRVFHNRQRLNIGGIYKEGLRHARHDYYLMIPGDNEVLVEEVVRGVRHLGRVGLAVSYTKNQEVRPRVRRILSRTYTRFVNLLFGTRFRYTNGTNIFPTDLLRRIEIRTNGFSYQTEALVKAIRNGVDFAEFGLKIRDRASGEAKALVLHNWIEVCRAIARLWWDVRVVNRRRYSRVGRKLMEE